MEFSSLRYENIYLIRGIKRCFLRFAPETIYLLEENEYNKNR